ncbi:MAG TPA: FMN-binding glutamate synthase family protein [Bacillota bacterium]|nr:FMN-binding glutamate synthase family protein [Bacillota bacterium]
MSKYKSGMGLLAALGAAGFIGTMAVKKISKLAVNKIHDDLLARILSDVYEDNLWELVSSTLRVGPMATVETSLRAQEGKLIERPMGPPRMFPKLGDIKFNGAQLHTMPTGIETAIDMKSVIGPGAKRPLEIGHFMMIAAMAYGIALSKKTKIAIAQGAAAANTATHVGAGPFLDEEREAAKYLIYQYNRGDWGKNPDILKQCNAVEIQLGQGAYAGVGHKFDSELLDPDLRERFNKEKGEDLITHSRHPEVQTPKDLVGLINRLRTITDGVPIGVKIAAGKELEADLDWVCRSGADFIVLDGAEAASRGSPPILQDDFGVPTVYAVDRAAIWMEEKGYKDRVSLIASGGIRTPGDALKVRALGANACQIGTIALLAVSDSQILKAMPFEPPTSIVFHGKKRAKKFNVEEGTLALKNFLDSCRLEIANGIRALGKLSIEEVNKKDLMTTDEVYAKALKIPMAYEPFTPSTSPPRAKKIKL